MDVCASPQLELLTSGFDLRKAMRSGGQIPPNNLPDPFLMFWYDPCQNISPWQSGKQRSEASVNNTENVRRKPVITTSCWHWERKHLLTILRERETERETGREGGRPRERQTDRERERDWEADKERGGERRRAGGREREEGRGRDQHGEREREHQAHWLISFGLQEEVSLHCFV